MDAVPSYFASTFSFSFAIISFQFDSSDLCCSYRIYIIIFVRIAQLHIAMKHKNIRNVLFNLDSLISYEDIVSAFLLTLYRIIFTLILVSFSLL